MEHGGIGNSHDTNSLLDQSNNETSKNNKQKEPKERNPELANKEPKTATTTNTTN